MSISASTNRLVEELIFSFTHNCEIDFMIPNVPPAGKYIEVALVVVVAFDGRQDFAFSSLEITKFSL
jgi:carboxymethylenebutenolidase